MASTYLTRSITSTNSSWTFSAWCKRSGLTSTQYLVSWGGSGTGQGIGFSSSDRLQYYSESVSSNPTSSAQFRDISGWYHVVVRNNAGTITLYVNGVALSNTGGNTGSALISTTLRIGEWKTNQYRWDGSMSHINFTDGTAYDASAFGETDSTTGEWKIITAPSVTYGSDGFFILKDGNSLTDQSGNSNDFTLGGGTLTKTEDCPSNVFNTMSPLSSAYFDSQYTFAHGNTYVEGNNTNNWKLPIPGTLAAIKGKYYWEVKQSPGSHTDYNIFGFAKANGYWNDATSYSNGAQNSIQTAAAATVTVYGQTGTHSNYVKISGSAVSITDNDIVSFALDLDNRKCWLAKNGVWVDDDSGNTNGSSINSSYPLWNTDDITADTFYTPVSVQYYDPQCYYNFGNGYFGNTAVSSAGTNASNNGIFEYDVPSGFTALSTKGLNI